MKLYGIATWEDWHDSPYWTETVPVDCIYAVRANAQKEIDRLIEVWVDRIEKRHNERIERALAHNERVTKLLELQKTLGWEDLDEILFNDGHTPGFARRGATKMQDVPAPFNRDECRPESDEALGYHIVEIETRD